MLLNIALHMSNLRYVTRLIHFSFMYIAPHQYIHYLKALYRVRSRPYNIIGRNPTINSSQHEQALSNIGGKKTKQTQKNLHFKQKKLPAEVDSVE